MMKAIPDIRKDPRYRDALLDISSQDDIPRRWHGTPIEEFILSQNFGHPVTPATEPRILISTCMEFRYALPVPAMYAYVIRRAGGRLVGSEFSMAYVISRGVEHIVMIGHNDCGMTKMDEHLPEMIDAFVDQGWDRTLARDYVTKLAPRYHVDDTIDALEIEFHRLRTVFKRVEIAPLFVSLFDKKLYLPKWYQNLIDTDGLSIQNTHVKDQDIIDLA